MTPIASIRQTLSRIGMRGALALGAVAWGIGTLHELADAAANRAAAAEDAAEQALAVRDEAVAEALEAREAIRAAREAALEEIRRAKAANEDVVDAHDVVLVVDVVP